MKIVTVTSYFVFIKLCQCESKFTGRHWKVQLNIQKKKKYYQFIQSKCCGNCVLYHFVVCCTIWVFCRLSCCCFHFEVLFKRHIVNKEVKITKIQNPACFFYTNLTILTADLVWVCIWNFTKLPRHHCWNVVMITVCCRAICHFDFLVK